MATIQRSKASRTKQDRKSPVKRTATGAKRFTRETAAPQQIVYRLARIGKVGKVLAAYPEPMTLDEAETISDEFGLGILAGGADMQAGVRKMRLRKPILERLAKLRAPSVKMTKEERAQHEADKFPPTDVDTWLTDRNAAITLYLVVLNGNNVVNATPSKHDAVHCMWMYRGDGCDAELWEKTISLVKEGPVEYWYTAGEVLQHSYINPIAAAAVCELGGSVDTAVYRVTKCEVPQTDGSY